VKHTAEELSFIGRFLAFLVRYIAPIGRPLEYVVQLIVRLMLRMFVFLFWHHVKDHLDDDVKRQHWIFLNFAYGNLRGLLKSNVIRKGFKHLDEYDYREWLEHYMRPDGRITIESPLSWFLHEALFAYIDGDHKKPDLSASVALYTLIRTASTWNGAVVWRMNAGMGDVVFTPLYQVLKHRNVKFKFFHRVDKIHLSDDHNSISSISIGKQVKLTDEDTEYNPLTGVKDLQCWPSTPLWDQIEDGDRYESDGLNFEAWGTPDQADNIVLHAGEHFDKVVLGISIGALPYICCDLITSEKNPDASMRWKKMVDNVKTVRTQALQLWTKQDSKTMGWDETAEGKFANRPMVGTYIASRNLSTWADMTEIIEREDWPESEQHPGQYPKSLGYFCGVLSDDPPIQLSDCGPLQSAHELDQESANHKAKENGRSFLQKYIRQFWPKAANDGEFDWDLLVDNRTGDPTGKERIDSQYYRGNVSPTERYVLSTKGSQKHRIAPGQSGYDNLYLAGDWTDNAYNAGCIEATVMSGIQASNAINGFPRSKNVVGYAYGEPTRNREARPAKSNELLQEATAEARRGYFTFVTMFLVFLIPTIFTLRSVKTGLGITVDYSLLSIEEVEDWGVFFTILSKYGPDPTPSPSNRVWTYLSDPIRQDIKYLAGTAVEDSMQLRPVLGALNAIVMDPEFYDDPSFAGVSHEPKIRKEIEDFLGKLSDRSLTQVEIQRLNRLLLVSSYPNHVLVSEPMSPMGYTKSLLLFLLPVLVLGGWFLRIPRHERDILMHRKAFWQVVLFFTAGGLAMDIFLGSHFFWFPIKSAVSGIHLPWLFTYPELGFVSTLPIEEAGFYLLASLFVLLFYIWMDLSWFSEYNKNKYVVLIKEVPTVLAPHKRSLLWGFAVFFLAYWVKKNGIFGWENHYSEGFPGYLSVMIFSFITLTFFLFRTVKLFINWRAFTLSVFIMWLMSVIWEVTLALPYG
ncbi:MAG: hypothetical protein HOH43_06320, partial [Candidatus Latescibacteria bacterium]|nr:hypothetical protein [Candidatus Latescibacterota bacterium]